MANLVIDIGNTYTKLAVFERGEMLFNSQHENVKAEALSELLVTYKISSAIISSVKKTAENWQAQLESKVKVTLFNNAMAAGVHNHYRTPQTLGADRLVGVVAAHYLYPGTNNLVIDGGTCITYDWVDADGNYFGGSISPGLKMRYNALNHYTSGLPLVNADTEFNGNYGEDTTRAIISGVQNGIKFELHGFIESYISSNTKLNIILTGGDSIFFDTLLKNSIFAPYIKIEPHLLLKGLNAATQQHNDQTQ